MSVRFEVQFVDCYPFDYIVFDTVKNSEVCPVETKDVADMICRSLNKTEASFEDVNAS